MQYSFKCPSPCNHEITVESKDDEEAMRKIMAAGRVHAAKAHPDMPPMTEQQMKDVLKAGMKNG